MLGFPKRRERLRSGIERAPQRVFPKHQRWVRGHACSVPNCQCRDIVFAHVRDSEHTPAHEKGGTGLKPHDRWGISLCDPHHQEQGNIGEPAFERKYGIDMGKIALRLAGQSPYRFEWLNP